jgi:hypothetical protein
MEEYQMELLFKIYIMENLYITNWKYHPLIKNFHIYLLEMKHFNFERNFWNSTAQRIYSWVYNFQFQIE